MNPEPTPSTIDEHGRMQGILSVKTQHLVGISCRDILILMSDVSSIPGCSLMVSHPLSKNKGAPFSFHSNFLAILNAYKGGESGNSGPRGVEGHIEARGLSGGNGHTVGVPVEEGHTAVHRANEMRTLLVFMQREGILKRSS
jgi:hypothetical protein